MPRRPLTARIYRGTPRNLSRLARALVEGELVAVPTETVYGLAADALNPRACRRIFSAKGRPTNDPLIVHIHSLAQLHELAFAGEAVLKLAKVFWPGPLTLVLPKKPVVSDLVTSGRPSVAVRMPRHPLFRELLQRCGRPLAAPSANPFGYISPTSALHVRDNLGKKIRYILDGGESAIGLESTILDLRNPQRPQILRPGAISSQAIARVLRCPVRSSSRRSVRADSEKAALAPGMLDRHYSPRTQLELHLQLTANFGRNCPAHEAALFLYRPREFGKTSASHGNVFWLAESRDLKAAAQSLFATLRTLDGGGWKKIHAELAPGTDALALAINDRLSRAAAKRTGISQRT